MAVIGSAIVDRDALETAVDVVAPSDFYAHVHETIFGEIVGLYEAGKPVDKISVAQRLRDLGVLEKCGGLPYLGSCMDTAPTAASVAYYGAIVREKAQLRSLIAAGAKIASLGFDGEDDADDAVAQAESVFSTAVDRGTKSASGRSLSKVFADNFVAVRSASEAQTPSGIQTPWPRLNKAIGPLVPGEMCLWVAGAGMGKSALVLQLADYIAAHYGHVAIASLEMSSRSVAMRFGALYGGVSARRQREGDLSEFEFAKLEGAYEMLKNRPITIFDRNAVPRLSDLRRELRLLSKHTKIAALVIDGINFLGDVDAQRGERSNRNERLEFVYRTLLRFASDFGMVVHAAQHVNREGMHGTPSLKDIRDGGNPEGHAHAIIAPYRPKSDGHKSERNDGEFLVLKARDGIQTTIGDMEFAGSRSMWMQAGCMPWHLSDEAAALQTEIDGAI